MRVLEFSLDELNELLRLRLRCDEDHMNLNWDGVHGVPNDPYLLQTSQDLDKLTDFILRIVEPRIAEYIGAVVNTEFADAFYEVKDHETI